MPPPSPDPSPRPSPLPLLLLAVWALPLVLLAGHVVNDLTARTRWLDLGAEANLPTWATSACFAAAAAACVAAAGGRAPGHRRAWLLVAALSLAMSVDEVVGVHEEAGRRLGAEATLSLVQPALAALVVALLLAAGAVLGGRERITLAAGATVLVVSQATASLGGLALAGGAVQGAEAIEEVTELLLAACLLAAALRAGEARAWPAPRPALAEARRWWRPRPVAEGDLTPPNPGLQSPAIGR